MNSAELTANEVQLFHWNMSFFSILVKSMLWL